MPIDINLDENSEGKVLSTEDIIYQILEDEEIGDENFASVDILKQPIYKIMTGSNGIVVKKPEEYVIDTNLLSNRSIATTKSGFTQFSNNSCSDRLKSLLNRLD